MLNNVLAGLSQIINTFGSMTVIPVMLFVISLAFGIKLKQALQTALYAGIGLTGYAFLIGAYLPVITPVIENMVSEAGVNLPIVDVGWQITAITAYSTQTGMIYLALGLIIQLVLFISGWTNVFQPTGLWDMFGYGLWGALVFTATKDIWLAIALMIVMNLWATTLFEMLAQRWSRYYGYPNCTLVQMHNAETVPFAIFSNWLLNKLGAHKIRWKADNLSSSLGFINDPTALGFLLGFMIGVLGNINRLGTLAGWGQITLVAFSTAAVMAIFPKIAAIFGQAFIALSSASEKYATSKGREEIYIGVDDSAGFGEPATLISGIILIPVMILLAAVLPGNRLLPLIDLVAIPFSIQTFIAFSNGNIFKTILSAAVWLGGGLLVTTAAAPLFSEVYYAIAPDVAGGPLVASMNIMSKPIWGGFTMLSINRGWIAVAVLFILYLVMTLWYKKNKGRVTDWLEKEAALDQEEAE
jgi:PTS system galactitol-specific IIC component